MKAGLEFLAFIGGLIFFAVLAVATALLMVFGLVTKDSPTEEDYAERLFYDEDR